MQPIDPLQYITNDLDALKRAVNAGVRWVQLRIKDQTRDQIRPIAIEALQFCKANDTKLIINDDVILAAEIGADGVHLGQTDMPATHARQIIGPDAIIGLTANTLEHLQQQHELNSTTQTINYIGLGPFRFTQTKAKLSPVLGLAGYQQIMEEYRNQPSVPIIAVGGIQLEDLSDLFQTKIYGVAISGAITNAPNKQQYIQQLKQIIASHQHPIIPIT